MLNSSPGIRPMGGQFAISNEFTGILIQHVKTTQGDRLEICIPKTGVRTYLDPMQLEAIASLSPLAFSELIENALNSTLPN